MFWLSIRFFFLSFRALLFVVGEIKRWSSLSLFSLQGEIGNHIIRLSLSLSLLRSARVLETPISLSNAPRHTKRERDDHLCEERRDIDASDTNSRAKAGKKKMDWISSHCGTRTAATKSSRVKDENAYIREQIYVTFRPPPRGMPPKFILPPLL